MARGGSAATTVASTSHLAARAGIRVFATGGLGGVHREARETWDESADLTTLAATGVTIVCAGVKSILDVGATLERLETLNVCVLGYGTDRFPASTSRTRVPVPGGSTRPEQVAAVMRGPGRARARAPRIVVANPLPGGRAGRPGAARPRAGRRARGRRGAGVRGGATTPFLLDRFHRETGGATLEANVALVRRNAELAARIAPAAAS